MSQLVQELTEQGFTSTVEKATRPILVDFWAPWCGPCRVMAPVLEQIAGDLTGKADVAKVNVDEAPDVAARYGIASIPSLILYVNGRPVKSWVGVHPRERLVGELEGALASSSTVC